MLDIGNGMLGTSLVASFLGLVEDMVVPDVLRVKNFLQIVVPVRQNVVPLYPGPKVGSIPPKFCGQYFFLLLVLARLAESS